MALRIFVAIATFSSLAHGIVIIGTGFEESSSLPAGWTESNVSGSATWTVQQGGEYGGLSPAAARSGTNNATLYTTDRIEKKTRLTSPAFNTVGYTNLSLTFWHTQARWDSDQDELKVFFSSDGGTNWTQLAHYTTDVFTWTQRTLVIPSASANSRIAFEGIAKYGHGVCLDDIQVTGVPASMTEVSVTATDATASEVGTDPGTWTITRIGNTTGAMSVNYTMSGTATLSSDYTVSSPSPINFAAGETSKVVTLTSIDDAVGTEGDELATLTLTTSSDYLIGTASSSISIYDDEGYDLNVLVIGSTRDSSEQFGGTSKPFSPTAIGTQLRSILEGSGLGSVNLVVTDCYAEAYTVMGYDAYAYNLASWFHWPFPKGAESARWANLRGQAGTDDWDYVVLIDDPYTIEYTPGVYAYGAAKIAEEVAKGGAETILLMPWPASGSSRDIAHYKDVVYRAGRSGGVKVAPGGLAWQAIKGSELTASNPDADGAFIAAASIYSTIYNQSAAVSSYVYNDTWADTVNTTEADNRNAQQYTGDFTFQNPYLFRSDSKRKIYFSSRGTSTENYFKGAAESAIGRCRVSVSTHSPWNRSPTDWTNNGGDEPWTKWPADFVPPIAWNHGRDGVTDAWYKSYLVNPAYWDFAYGYIYHANTWSDPLEDANDHFVSMMFGDDNELANRMMSQGDSARNLPVRTLWAQIHKEFPSLNPLMDGSGPHLNQLEHEAVGTYMYTLYSGRCPLDPEPAVLDRTWVARKIGYETAWRLGRCQMRAPGFKVMPSAASKTSINPKEKETMTVQFILPPKQDVTVNISISNSNAAIVGSKQLVFTPQNYNVPQNVVVTGLPGSAASDPFDVVFTTASTDEVYNGLSDTWNYTTTRSAPVTLTRVNKTTQLVTACQNLPMTINLNTAGATSSNTVLAGPGRGTAVWSGSNIIYTPSSDFLGKDGFSFATNDGTTLSVGYVEITVTTATMNGMVSYRGNGSDGGTVPMDSSTYAQSATVTVLGNTGNLTRVGYNFAGWNTEANGSGTAYNAGATFTMGASGVALHAQWIAVPTYTVTYNGNGNNSGTAPPNQIKTDGVNLAVPGNPYNLAKNYHTFAGWNTAANGNGTDYTAGSPFDLNANTTLYAKWTPNNYTVTFNANGRGTPSPATKTVTYSQQYGTLATISYPGYTFNGWFTATAGGTKVNPTSTVTQGQNHTIYAQWTALPTYAVSYDPNQAETGTVPANQSKIQDLALTLATNSGALARTGYIFTGWNTAADGTGIPYLAGDTYNANETVTLYAQWIGTETYTISYIGNGNDGGTVPSNQTKTQGVSLALATNSGNLTNVGHSFAGWNTDASGSGTDHAAGETYTADAPLTLYAKWNPLPVVNAGVDQTVTMQGAAWTPAMLAPLAWYDASDTLSVVLSDSTVSQWSDESGNGRHIAQTTAANQPTYNTNAISFDGTSDYLWRDGAFLYANGQADVFIVGAIAALADRRIVAEGSSTTNTPAYCIAQNNGTTASMMGAFLRNDANSTTPGQLALSPSNSLNNTTKILQWRDTGTSFSARINSVAQSTVSYTRSGTYTLNRFAIGGLLRTSPNFYTQGTIHEIVITNNLSDTNRQKLEGHLAHKWALAADLPSGHPYENAPPGVTSTVDIDGTVTDTDAVTTTWSLVSGPASVTFANPAAIDTTATFTAAGVYTLRLTANDGSAQVTDDVVIRVSTPTLYTAWKDGTFSNSFIDKASTSNPDGDNLTNLQEFAFGTDPTASTFNPLTYVPNGTTNAGIPIFENTGTAQSPSYRAVFARRKNHASEGISYEVQFSANLEHWKASTVGLSVLSGSSSAEVEAVSVPFPASVPLSAAETEFAAPKFYRVGVSEN